MVSIIVTTVAGTRHVHEYGGDLNQESKGLEIVRNFGEILDLPSGVLNLENPTASYRLEHIVRLGTNDES